MFFDYNENYVGLYDILIDIYRNILGGQIYIFFQDIKEELLVMNEVSMLLEDGFECDDL